MIPILSEFNFRKTFIICIFFILLSLKSVFAGSFLDTKKLSLYDAYFVVLDTGLYLYNFNNLDCSLIYKFNETKTSNDKILINELYDEYNAYILCLVNKYLFIFDESTNKTYQKEINNIEIPKNNYYDILPYKIEDNNISFYISFNNETENLIFYYYDFTLNESIINSKEI